MRPPICDQLLQTHPLAVRQHAAWEMPSIWNGICNTPRELAAWECTPWKENGEPSVWLCIVRKEAYLGNPGQHAAALAACCLWTEERADSVLPPYLPWKQRLVMQRPSFACYCDAGAQGGWRSSPHVWLRGMSRAGCAMHSACAFVGVSLFECAFVGMSLFECACVFQHTQVKLECGSRRQGIELTAQCTIHVRSWRICVGVCMSVPIVFQ